MCYWLPGKNTPKITAIKDWMRERRADRGDSCLHFLPGCVHQPSMSDCLALYRIDPASRSIDSGRALARLPVSAAVFTFGEASTAATRGRADPLRDSPLTYGAHDLHISANVLQRWFGEQILGANRPVPLRRLPVHHLPVMLPQHLYGVVGLHARPLEPP
jgi:hypothetical protein